MILGLTIAATFAVGCGRPQDAGAPGPTRPRSSASVAIREPAPGALLSGSRVRVLVELKGGRVVPQVAALRSYEGRIHITLDGNLVSVLSGLEQEVDVTPGQHLLQVEFAAADHLPFETRVVTTVAFTVQ